MSRFVAIISQGKLIIKIQIYEISINIFDFSICYCYE
jgi:hypothetical protein